EAEYRRYIARLNALPRHVDGLIEQLREGMRTGWTVPRAIIAPVPAMLRQLRENAIDGALGQPLRAVPSTIAQEAREALVADGLTALRTQAMPALRRDYLPVARESIGASALPGGARYYEFLAAQYSGSSLSPAQIHALGLKEVERIKGELASTIARTGFKGSFTQFAAFANSDPRLFYANADALLERYRRIVARTRDALPRLFDGAPPPELLVKPAPALGAEARGAAWYDAGSGERPAAFVVNTSRLDHRPMWEVETLALHEGMPGHHLQVARMRANAALPPFRRHGWNVAYGEGWALYAESLGPELGLYRDAFSAFGRLNSELFRAARLVVDTGIHALGWSRQQALDYLNANTANSLADNEVEVDRYIAWPAQALGYKMGELAIRALRSKAEGALGERFDLRRFHSVVLDGGALPIPLLEQQVNQWIASSMPPPTPPAMVK
ncbi:MAG: DUF885 domain-containing protein, partial [Gammaproteobacteria bacterium]